MDKNYTIVAFTLSYWDDKIRFDSIKKELLCWSSMVDRKIKPTNKFISCGTYSDPTINDTGIKTINSYTKKTLGYDPYFWNYAACAEVIGMYYALLNHDFDILVQVCTDSIINIDMVPLCEEFMNRKEIVMSPHWHVGIEDAFVFYKKEAVVKYLNEKPFPNLRTPMSCNDSQPTEFIKAKIFENQWYKLWPDNKNWRMENHIPSESAISKNWPLIIRPTNKVVDWYWEKEKLNRDDIPNVFKIYPR